MAWEWECIRKETQSERKRQKYTWGLRRCKKRGKLRHPQPRGGGSPAKHEAVPGNKKEPVSHPPPPPGGGRGGTTTNNDLFMDPDGGRSPGAGKGRPPGAAESWLLGC